MLHGKRLYGASGNLVREVSLRLSWGKQRQRGQCNSLFCPHCPLRYVSERIAASLLQSDLPICAWLTQGGLEALPSAHLLNFPCYRFLILHQCPPPCLQRSAILPRRTLRDSGAQGMQGRVRAVLVVFRCSLVALVRRHTPTHLPVCSRTSQKDEAVLHAGDRQCQSGQLGWANV